MTWKDLTPNNIEEIKQLYIDYLKDRHHEAMSFEDFIECVEQCKKCKHYDLTANMVNSRNNFDTEIYFVCENCYGDKK